MNAKKRPSFEPFDPSLHPTRKVESMSSIAAELLLKEHDGGFEEQSGRRLRSERPGALDAYAEPAPWPSQPWPTGTPPPPFAGAPSPFASPPPFAAAPPAYPTRTPAARIALLVGGAVLLVVLSVTITLLVSR